MTTPRTLALFAKQPFPGRVKTRLASATSPEWAAALSEAFLLDALDSFQGFPGRRVLVYDPPEADNYFQSVATGRFALVPQTGGDLGQRLLACFESEFALGSSAVIIVGTDSPTLPISIVLQAAEDLNQSDVVVGPATDGGYYLIGCTGLLPALFRGVSWSTNRVFSETIARIAEAGAHLSLLPPWYDVDTLDDVRMLRNHLAAMRVAGMTLRPLRTEALLEVAT